mmetsp:Transcript_37529/g.62138  ORF Transcript_37529/g.62138 Transcript_37529/m.62138 type:complete len:384 (-) Transcript_37529:49-1200(-)
MLLSPFCRHLLLTSACLPSHKITLRPPVVPLRCSSQCSLASEWQLPNQSDQNAERGRLRLLFVAAGGIPLLAMIVPFVPRIWQATLRLCHAYEVAAIAHPLLTKSATSGVAYTAGDVLAQRLSKSAEQYDVPRMLRSMTAGTVSHGPQLHYWTLILERYFSFGGAPWALGVKILLDQTFFAVYLNGAYCMLVELLRRRTLREALRGARASSWPSLKASWRFWPLVHALTYSVVPFHLRVLWVDVIEIVWIAILSTCVARTCGVGDCAVEECVVDMDEASMLEGEAAGDGGVGVHSSVDTGVRAWSSATTFFGFGTKADKDEDVGLVASVGTGTDIVVCADACVEGNFVASPSPAAGDCAKVAKSAEYGACAGCAETSVGAGGG